MFPPQQGNELGGISEGCQHTIWRHTMDLINDANLNNISQRSCGHDLENLKCKRLEWVAFSDFRLIAHFLDACSSNIDKYMCGRLQPSESLTQGQTLACLQQHIDKLDEQCQKQIYHLSEIQADNIIMDRQLYLACINDHSKFCPEIAPGSGNVYKCLMQHKLDRMMSQQCQDQLLRRQKVIARDYRVSKGLARACKEDIKAFHCRRDVSDEKDIRLAQILLCLEGLLRNGTKVTKDCQMEMVEHRKILMEDYRLSPEIVSQCSEDITKFCNGLEVGGKTIHCLMEHTRPRKKRERVSFKCQRAVETLVKEADAGEDWRVDPVLREACKPVVDNSCKDVRGGDARVMSCLMEKLGTDHMTEACELALVQIQYFVARDYKLDPQLYRQCRDDAVRLCHAKKVWADDNASMDPERGPLVLPCLYRYAYHSQKNLKKLPYKIMTFTLDVRSYVTQLGERRLMLNVYLVLHGGWEGKKVVVVVVVAAAAVVVVVVVLLMDCIKENPVQKFFDYEIDGDKSRCKLGCTIVIKLKVSCLEEIRRVMRQRAISVDLQPEIEEVCLEDLALNCYEKTNRGEEMVCLQDNLERLTRECKSAVSNFTEDQAQHVELNPEIMAVCQGVMEKHCEAELKMGRDEGDLMECLIEHKNELDVRSNYKCRAAIEHFQLISLKNYHFTYKFKEACRPHVQRFCPDARTKYDVIRCLSEKVRNDTLRESKHSIPRECRQQLRAQLFQQRENINFDPVLRDACQKDIIENCPDVTHGAGQVLECLQINKARLTPRCHRAIFNVEKQELLDSSGDYTLLTTCRLMIRQFCHEEDEAHALECLKRYKDEKTFDSKCKVIVVRRMIEQNQDYRFNPLLQKGCHQDIPKFCSEVVATEPKDLELEGKVIKCLKIKFRERKLRLECEQQMATILREAALNYQLNPLLMAMCKKEIKVMCKADEEEEDSAGAVEECLKNAFLTGRIIDPGCRLEVANVIEEAKADIHVDPLLHQACGVDVSKFCSDIPQGAGRHIQCLQNVLQDSTKTLQPKCQTMLTKRIDMFKNAALIVVEPQTVEELYGHISRSPARVYFSIVALSLVGVILIAGFFCGRVTRRSAIMKNK
uniref:Golgi apparatus protein 1 n=1 Tax=Timema monikensis TaxID=170555 RepID=A0A7R9HNT1_9NEOP|nr:unnamed protein product [Timema monikensis]